MCIPKNGEALPGGDMVDIDDGATGDHRTEAGGLAEDHIGFAGIRTPVTGEWRPDDQVVEAVAIDVPGRRETPAGTVTISMEDEALLGAEVRQVNYRVEAVGLAE